LGLTVQNELVAETEALAPVAGVMNFMAVMQVLATLVVMEVWC